MSADQEDRIDKLIDTVQGLRDDVRDLTEISHRHESELYGDPGRGREGVVHRVTANERGDRMTLQELRALDDKMESMHTELLEKIGSIVLWKEAIQSAPKNIKMILITMASLCGALLAIWAFITKLWGTLG